MILTRNLNGTVLTMHLQGKAVPMTNLNHDPRSLLRSLKAPYYRKSLPEQPLSTNLAKATICNKVLYSQSVFVQLILYQEPFYLHINICAALTLDFPS